ncbi:Protein bfr2 OS=Schizosaccharomyces pombe (strain 972 / ATCC 24843) GN=bfr2 PE=1 SV=1 [Rhizoctonia solani AG-1 IB]|uniref:Protein BFR2 n=1 Tax=Thanatephorus cucumeris (strain AG1-IB / isolate 7/3/14) TaxID=1108050 RepID=A0A0B7FH11_THACB|nr:Protein bfr2 OS=Schizosaccharomyces pombe (strain 972 / ATCC 24843) GN=bfr2 PE=1 SV=1 [Rhizoctonia solani AG-1 IB]
MSPLSLAEQIAQLEDTAPPDVDIERVDGGFGEEAEDNDLTAGRGHYLDVGASSLRKQQNALVDPKYEGVRTSRSQLYEFDDVTDEDVEGGSTAGETEEDSEESVAKDEENINKSHSISEDEEEQSEGDSDDESVHSQSSDAAPDHTTDNLTAALKKSREVDKDKGRAIIQQRALWDSLLETRIRLQKAATATNRLPHPNDLAPYVTSENGRAAVHSLLREVLSFSDELLTLRKRLAQVNEPEIEVPPSKKRKIDFEDENFERESADATVAAVEMDAVYHPACVRTLQKWSNKIAAVTPASLSARSGRSFRGGGATRSTVELVQDALGESGAKAVGRTRVRRSAGARIGAQVSLEADGAEGDAEVFDDLDFYQALLRDVIDSRTGAEDDWMVRQRMKKAKKVVDTKASKGRKLRYEVHEKLQNFMVPVPTATWHEEQIDELFANLLGKEIGRIDPVPA